MGFEEDANNFTPEFSKKTIYEAQYWFIKERDSMVFQKFMNYFDNNKDDKYLFYYGLGHLQKDYVNKKLPNFFVGKDSCYGYFLLGYLKMKFGENDVLSIAKLMIPSDKLKRMGLDSLINKKLLTKSENVKNKSLNSQQYDYYFFNPFVNISDHAFILVYSKKVFEKAIEKLSLLDKTLPGTWVYDFGRKMLKKLSYLAGVDFNSINELKFWFNRQKSFDLNHFESKEYRNNFFKIYAKDEDDENAKILLRQFGFEEDMDEYFRIDSSEWNNKFWPEALKNIKFINAIGIYWSGYPDEKIKAKEFLKNFSGEDYNEPEKYLQWWRNIYHNYDI